MLALIKEILRQASKSDKNIRLSDVNSPVEPNKQMGRSNKLLRCHAFLNSALKWFINDKQGKSLGQVIKILGIN